MYTRKSMCAMLYMHAMCRRRRGARRLPRDLGGGRPNCNGPPLPTWGLGLSMEGPGAGGIGE